MPHRSTTVAVIVIAALVPAAALLVACGSTSSTSTPTPTATTPSAIPSGSTVPSAAPGTIAVAPGRQPVAANDFVAVIDTPWSPLKAGTEWVSQGIKDGTASVDHSIVTGQTEVIEGVTCSVIWDALKQNGKVVVGM